MSGTPVAPPARLRLDPTAFVAPGAVVVGDVTLGARASVWFQAVVRGDGAPIAIGDDSNVQDGSVVHVDEDAPAVIGRRVTVGHRAIVHGCTVADDCLIGMGAIVLSRARIGAGSLVGAGALVPEGREIPPGSLVLGAPARVLGRVNDRHRAAIREGSEHYVRLSRGYLAHGFARAFPPPGAPGGISPGGAAMTHREWEGCVAALAAGPAWAAERLASADAARARRRPGEGRWSALEVLAHLRDADRDVYVPRLARLLAEPLPWVEDVDLTAAARVAGYAAFEPQAVLAEWRGLRAGLVAALAPLGPDAWARAAVHSRRGTFTLGAMVRAWAEHDLGHRRQLAGALAEAG